jgi:hypothetical protein
MMRPFIILGWAFAMPLFAQPTKAPIAPMTTTLCEVSKNPSAYDGKEIVFQAQYTTDHIERSLLISGSCPGEGMLPYLKDNAIGAAAFNDAIWVRSPANLKESITATFTGTFHFADKPEMCMFLNKEVCRRSIEIKRVDDLRLTMTPK